MLVTDSRIAKQHARDSIREIRDFPSGNPEVPDFRIRRSRSFGSHTKMYGSTVRISAGIVLQALGFRGVWLPAFRLVHSGTRTLKNLTGSESVNLFPQSISLVLIHASHRL